MINDLRYERPSSVWIFISRRWELPTLQHRIRLPSPIKILLHWFFFLIERIQKCDAWFTSQEMLVSVKSNLHSITNHFITVPLLARNLNNWRLQIHFQNIIPFSLLTREKKIILRVIVTKKGSHCISISFWFQIDAKLWLWLTSNHNSVSVISLLLTK